MVSGKRFPSARRRALFPAPLVQRLSFSVDTSFVNNSSPGPIPSLSRPMKEDNFIALQIPSQDSAIQLLNVLYLRFFELRFFRLLLHH